MKQQGLDFGPPDETPKVRPSLRQRKPLGVFELTQRLAGVLETEFHDVWVAGEVSNLKRASSGHVYLTLKDDRAQLRAVIWKTAARLIRFDLRDGLQVVARGGVRVYPPRGEYQLSVELVEPLGKGSLQQAFEDLKERLSKEGLFDPERKRPLPLLPRRIGVVTSPTGAVVRDILRVLKTRFANLDVLIYPARVQGAEAAPEIVAGIRALNRIPDLDVLIVARGGGSIEDLWCFNDEGVARALAASKIPTLSAVGHETDFTIADFVADHRAPTPSAAAERVVAAKHELSERIAALDGRARAALRLRLERIRQRVAAATSHRVFEAERGRLRSAAQRLDELSFRSGQALRRLAGRDRDRLRHGDQRLQAFRFDRQLAERRASLGRLVDRLAAHSRARLEAGRGRLGRLAGKLESLSPLSVLGRGYALVFEADGRRLVRHPDEVDLGAALRIRVHGGGLRATVTDKEVE